MKRALPLSTRTLVWSFGCMCAVLAVGFFVLDMAIKSLIKDGLKASLERTEQQLDQASAEYDRRNAQLLAILSKDAGLKAALGLVREQRKPSLQLQIRNTIEDHLREISRGLDFDLLAVLDTKGSEVAAVGRSFGNTLTPSLQGLRPGVSTPVLLGQNLYEVTSLPINLGAENFGTLVVGKKFDLQSGRFGYSVLIGPKGIIASTLPPGLQSEVSRQVLTHCISSTAIHCEIRLGKNDFLVLRRSHAGAGAPYQLFYLASMSEALTRFTRGFWQAFLATGLVGVLMALLLAAFVSRSISTPLARLAVHIENSGESSDLPEEYHIESSTLEVNVLAQALNRASRARRQFEKDLIKAKEGAEAASRAKSEFLANISHELRTPMNGILGLTELVLDTELTSEQYEYLRMLQDSGKALLNVISDILDFSSIERGRIDLNFSEFSLREWLTEIIAAQGPQARGKGLNLESNVQADVPDAVVCDPFRLRQILMHLIANAIKFTERGGVKVRVTAERDEANGVQLHFCVEDTGIGIPADKQKVIFEAFSQADGSATRHYGGTGLGLTISSRLVSLMQGRIWVESEVEKGSQFHFTVPCEAREHSLAEINA